jgi:LysM repeat protein
MARTRRTAAAAALAGVVAGTVTVMVVPADAATSYVVQPGDTLSEIAVEHGVSTAELAAANGITDHHLIRTGQVLTVPTPDPVLYTVQPGDTLSEIARDFGVPAAEIMALNGITDPHRIRIGTVLSLPASGGGSVADVAARYPSLPDRIVANPDRLALISSFERWSAHYGVPADLLMAIAYQESGWQTSVVSNKGAIGVGQLLPGTATWIARDLIGIPELDPNVPDDNIRMSARFLAWLIGYLDGEQMAVAGYYQGPTSVTVFGLYGETERYVANVEVARARFRRS